MKQSKRTPKSEKALALSFEKRRGKLSSWSKTPSKARVRKGAGVVFSIRFSADELEELRQQAKERGVTLSEYIRQAAVSRPSHTAVLEWLLPAGSNLMVCEPTGWLLNSTKTEVVVPALVPSAGHQPRMLFDDRQKFLLSLES